MCKLFVKIENLPHLSTVNQFILEFIQILKDFLPTSYRFGTAYTLTRRTCSEWTKLYTELLLQKKFSLKNGCSKAFRNE